MTSEPSPRVGTVGIVGVGHLAGYLVAGLVRADPGTTIVLSPRNAERSRQLASRYGLSVARNNADVVERSDVVLLATRPPDLLRACRDLPWRSGQTAISVAAGIRCSDLHPRTSPATLVRALPIAAAEIGLSSTCLFPDHPIARRLFEQLGSVHFFDDEGVFEVASTHGVVFSTFHAVVAAVTAWFEDSGVPGEEGRALAAEAIRATAAMVLAHPETSLDSMVDEYAVPGTLTLRALERLGTERVLEGLRAALEVALQSSRELAGQSLTEA